MCKQSAQKSDNTAPRVRAESRDSFGDCRQTTRRSTQSHRGLGPAARPHNGGAKLLGGSGSVPPILAHLGRQTRPTYPPASRVSFSDLLCELDQANHPRGHSTQLRELCDPATLPPPPPSRSGKTGWT